MLTLEELKKMKKGDTIWLVDKEIAPNTGYWGIKSINITHILLQKGLMQFLVPYALYGEMWVAYKNKEQAEMENENAD